MNRLRKLKNSFKIELLVLIAVNELAKAFIVQSSTSWDLITSSQFIISSLLTLYYTTQLMGAPLFGFLSDHFFRKKTLIFIYSLILISQIMTFSVSLMPTTLLTIGVLLNGFFGNGDVVGRAMLLDLCGEKETRNILAISFGVTAIPWILVEWLLYFNLRAAIPIIIIFIVVPSIYYLIFYMKDPEDKKRKEDENKKLLIGFGKGCLLTALMGILLFEFGFQLVFLSQDMHLEVSKQEFSLWQAFSTTSFAVSFMLGCILSAKSKFKDFNGILVGVLLSMCSLFAAVFFDIENGWPMILVFGVFSLASGIYLPCFFSHFARLHKIHQRGFLFGIIESAMVLAEMIASSLLGKNKISLISTEWVGLIVFLIGFFLILRGKNQKIQNRDRI